MDNLNFGTGNSRISCRQVIKQAGFIGLRYLTKAIETTGMTGYSSDSSLRDIKIYGTLRPILQNNRETYSIQI